MTFPTVPDNGAIVRPPFAGRARYAAAALGGFLAAAIAVTVGHLVAVIIAPAASPLLALGSTFIDLTPEWLKSFAIRTFGVNDKMILLGGMVLTLAFVAIAVGIVGLRRPRLAVAAIAGFGLVGAIGAALRPAASELSVIPSLIGALAGIAGLVALQREAAGPTSDTADVAAAADARSDASVGSRRRFLAASAAVGALIAGSGGLGVFLAGRRASTAVGAGSFTLPAPLEPATVIPAGADLGIADVAPFITPNDQFYRVDTALEVPAIAAIDWRLRIHGMVDREINLTLAELLELPSIERDITLTCVSNQVGGEYSGNARWIGIPLGTVLDEAGIQAGADQIVSRSIDGMTIGTPTAVALDGRDAMLAVAMNGEPLPQVHGYPVRLIVPGLYGYVSATKWLVELELTTFDAYDPYWVERGWSREAPIKTMSRIDAPRALARIPAGKVAIGGVAWAQQRGVERVEVRVDGGAWGEAQLGSVDTIDTWRQWVFEWDALSGNHTLEVRATDATGKTQPEERAEPFPNGATGWHSVVVTVT